MEEPVFIKCEPEWPLDAEQTSDSEQNTLDNQLKIKEDPCSAVAEEVDIKEVKESFSDEDELDGGFKEECDISEGSSLEIRPSTTPNITVTLSHDSTAVDEVSWSCSSCGRSFRDEDHLTKHVTHSREHPFLTTCCPKEDNCPLLGKGRYFCESCNKNFPSRKLLIEHLSTHRGPKPHYCSMCDRSFSERRNLKSHILTHIGYRPHVCSTCGLGFARRSCLNRHKATHTSSRPYFCSICGKAFKHPSSVKKHSVMHNPEKRFSCEICSSSFYRADNLKVHMLVHDRTLAHDCATCGKTFRHLVTLKRHIKTGSCRGQDAMGCSVMDVPVNVILTQE